MDIGKIIILIGVVLVVIGVAYTMLGGIPRLPGDIFIKRGNFTFYFPVVTSILLSVIFTLIFYFLRK